MPERGRYYLETFGCQMNVNDSEKVAGLLREAGYAPAADPSRAEVVFVNTCAVREKAARKLRHRLDELRHLPAPAAGRVVAVGGCVAQLHGEKVLDSAPDIDVLVGTHNLSRVPELVEQVRRTGRRGVDLDRNADTFSIPDRVVAHSNPVRAFVTVAEGCNHVCSFCVVPRTRGPEVCREPEAIEAEVRSLVARGVPEVMLLGQTVNAYRHAGHGFADLLRRIDAVPGLQRLRFTTSHPEHVDESLAQAFRELPRLCPYLHLPPQSGSDRILSDMRRGYTRSRYLETVALLRQARPDLALSGDVIVGYPGETEDDFVATLDLVDAVGFDGLFTFTYSPRPGTAAGLRPDDVPEEEKSRRLAVLNERQQRFQRERHALRVGTREQVLAESIDAGRLSGRSGQFRIVHFDGPPDLIGRLVDVEITGFGSNSLQGRLDGPPGSLTGEPTVSIF